METKQNEYEPLLTGTDLAYRLQISIESAYRLMRENAITTVRFGRSVRVRPCDLEDFIVQQSTGKMKTS